MGKYVKDAVHGDIEILDDLLPIVDHPLFQRLRRIKQLSLAYLVYPSAHHTRFEHSLGVYHITRHATEEIPVWVYALLHDVGHGPFSHLIELALADLGYVAHHEEQTKMFAKEILQDSVFSFSEVFENRNNLLVHGGVGADRIDYIMRDSYFTGVEIGYVDWQRLVRNTWVEGRKLCISPKVVSNAEHLYIARFILADAVYFHKTVLIIDMMFIKAVEDLLSYYSPEEIMRMDDVEFASALRRIGSVWWDRIEKRNLYKIVFRGEEDEAKEIYERYRERFGDGSVVLGRRFRYYSRPDVCVEGVGTLLEVSPLLRSLQKAEEKRVYWFVAVDPRILRRGR